MVTSNRSFVGRLHPRQVSRDVAQLLPRPLARDARGEAQQTINEAEGYALQRVNTARGDSARFVAVFDEYRLAPDVTKKRIYLETMNAILKEEPSDLASLFGDPPTTLVSTIRRCLEKRPEARFQSGHDLAFALRSASQEPSGSVASPPS